MRLLSPLMFNSTRGLELKTVAQLKLMRKAGLVVAKVHQELATACSPGVTTAELDTLARDILRAEKATSNFLNYGSQWGNPYPAVACISVNEEVVHGIPGERVLQAGDLVSIDFGAIVQGWHGDAAISVEVGQVSPEVHALNVATKKALWEGIAAARLGGKVSHISAAIEDSILAEPAEYGIVEDYTGHGIGSAMHQPPDVPNYRTRGRCPKIVPGLVLAIEPMITLGSAETVTLDDDWTVVTTDKSIACHWEHSITVTQQGLWVLTAPDGGEAELTARGLPFGPLAD